MSEYIHSNLNALERSATLAINEHSDNLEKQGKHIFRFGFGQAPFPIPDKVVNSLKERNIGVLITDHNVRNLFDITDRSYVISEGNVIAEGTSRELLKSSKAIEHYFGSQFS